MIKLLTTSIGRLRIISFLEGISLVVLLGITMPLKYALDMPKISFVAGLVHGVLFLIFAFMLMGAAVEHKWKLGKVLKIVLFSCLIPFGFLYTDRKILVQNTIGQ